MLGSRVLILSVAEAVDGCVACRPARPRVGQSQHGASECETQDKRQPSKHKMLHSATAAREGLVTLASCLLPHASCLMPLALCLFMSYEL